MFRPRGGVGGYEGYLLSNYTRHKVMNTPKRLITYSYVTNVKPVMGKNFTVLGIKPRYKPLIPCWFHKSRKIRTMLSSCSKRKYG